LVVLLAGCESTSQLWTGKPEDAFVKVVPTTVDEDVEVALRQSGREYYCQHLYDSTYPNNKYVTPGRPPKTG
jgi:hypothetical protein